MQHRPEPAVKSVLIRHVARVMGERTNRVDFFQLGVILDGFTHCVVVDFMRQDDSARLSSRTKVSKMATIKVKSQVKKWRQTDDRLHLDRSKPLRCDDGSPPRRRLPKYRDVCQRKALISMTRLTHAVLRACVSHQRRPNTEVSPPTLSARVIDGIHHLQRPARFAYTQKRKRK